MINLYLSMVRNALQKLINRQLINCKLYDADAKKAKDYQEQMAMAPKADYAIQNLNE